MILQFCPGRNRLGGRDCAWRGNWKRLNSTGNGCSVVEGPPSRASGPTDRAALAGFPTIAVAARRHPAPPPVAFGGWGLLASRRLFGDSDHTGQTFATVYVFLISLMDYDHNNFEF
jgi:hypothetical protein